jgi:hypothetical protein
MGIENLLLCSIFFDDPFNLPMYGDGELVKKKESYKKLKHSDNSFTVNDFPASGFQLHIHEGEEGTAHIWDYKREKKFNISSYDAAIMDLIADNLNRQPITQEEIDEIFKEDDT